VEHPKSGGNPHDQSAVATDQTVLICHDCGLAMTTDAIDAGLPVVNDVLP